MKRRRTSRATTAVLGALILMAPGPAVSRDGTPDRGLDVVVADPDRDAEGDAGVRRLSELRQVRYRVDHVSNQLTITTRFARLADGGRKGTVGQSVGVLISRVGGCQNSWLVTANNSGRAHVRYEDYCGSDSGTVEPALLKVERDLGPNGALRVKLSTESIGDGRVRMRTVAQAGNGRAWDFSRFTSPVRLE